MAQRLAAASSQYLRQHAHQQVDWFPYGDEAFAEARRRDVPVMLSIGYAACHWCHVMSHESFDDARIATLLNTNFVAIKVDREEHPLVDDTYMLATQALTGAGGWPMTVFTLPDGRAFHAGTYYPAEPRGSMPSFTQVLTAVAEAWRTRRTGIQEQAGLLAEHLAELGSRQNALFSLSSQTPAVLALGQAVEAWNSSTRPEGGFSPAPKFPATWALHTLTRALVDPDRRTESFTALATHLEAILCGGLHDHAEGGFARYCVDEHWAVPHFEKMLYDNAGLLSLCARASVLTAEYARTAAQPERQRAERLSGLARSAAVNTAEFLRDQLLTGGALASSLDADSLRDGHSVEGAYYTVTHADLGTGSDLPQGLVRLAEVAEDPGHYCLSLARPPQPAEQAAWAALRSRLREVRTDRARPGRDEKIVAGWNGLAIEALAEACELLDEPFMGELAEEIAQTLWRVHVRDGKLARVSFAGRADHGNEATLQDYAALTLGFLALSGRGAHWVERADVLLDRAAQFIDQGTGVPADGITADPRLTAQRSAVTAASLLDDALPAAGALYARAVARRALCAQNTADQRDTAQEAAAAGELLQLADSLSAHALALSAEAPAQVATALRVQAVLAARVQYIQLSWAPAEAAQAARVRKLCRALDIEVHESTESPTHTAPLRIQPCRDQLCSTPVDSPEEFLTLLGY